MYLAKPTLAFIAVVAVLMSAVVGDVEAGALEGKKLLVDTVFNIVDDNANKVNEGVNTIEPPVAGDTVKVELFIEDGGGVSTLGGGVKFADSNMDVMFGDSWKLVGVKGIGVLPSPRYLKEDEFTLLQFPAAPLPKNGYFATVEILALVDIEDGTSFHAKTAIITTDEVDTLDVSEAIVTVESSKGPTTFSISLDGNTAAGDQSVTSLGVGTGSVFPVQIFADGIRGVNGVSAKFEYDAAQVGYEEFDPGSLLPNAQVLAVPATNPTAIEISVVSFGGQATPDSGMVGSVRFQTTDDFSGTTLRLVRAEIGRGNNRESITPSDIAVTLKLSNPTPDFNGDGRVDFGDFVALGMHFGTSRGDARYDAKYDLDQDGTIGFGDFLIFGQAFGT